MNIAIVFAGGTGQRMNTSSKPKQFLELNGKPIIIYTLEHFERHEMIDGIIVVCVKEWIDYCRKLTERFDIRKIKAIIPGGETGFLSRYEGVKEAARLYTEDTICLMHDGVRPLIDQDIISRNILLVQQKGSAVTVAPAIETIAVKVEDNKVGQIIDRSKCQMAKAPQSFILKDLLQAHQKAVESGVRDCIDTAYLMQHSGFDVYTVEGSSENIKITTPTDYYTFKAIMEMKENPDNLGAL